MHMRVVVLKGLGVPKIFENVIEGKDCFLYGSVEILVF